MNIKEAKEQIKNAMTAYFSKDKFGEYEIPVEKQRPVFLMGPPGIGKTAIMEQVAQELKVGLVSYSMTHHTRQSALGLPYIEKKVYDGEEFSISEYTMSEIIASVYDMMESTGIREGILFLDEINCVSETLAPAMLQFLQFKIFGRHKVPKGWIVVTAGNPPEYNSSVREFDIVTWDRLKRIDVEPDYEVWKEFAYKTNVHAAITTYLDIKKGDFYKVESTVDGKSFVTARGWSDLSAMMRLYEKHDLKIDEKLIGQYIQNRKIAKDFAVYYDLYVKYRSDYQVDKILSGSENIEVIKGRAASARFDERLSLLGLLLDGCGAYLRSTCLDEGALKKLMESARLLRAEFTRPGVDVLAVIDRQTELIRRELANGIKAGSVSEDERYAANSAIAALEADKKTMLETGALDAKAAFAVIKADFDKRSAELKASAELGKKTLTNMFSFCEKVFGDGQEMVILVTELTVNYHSSHFIARYGCKEYFAHNKELLFYERQKEIISEIENFGL